MASIQQAAAAQCRVNGETGGDVGRPAPPLSICSVLQGTAVAIAAESHFLPPRLKWAAHGNGDLKAVKKQAESEAKAAVKAEEEAAEVEAAAAVAAKAKAEGDAKAEAEAAVKAEAEAAEAEAKAAVAAEATVERKTKAAARVASKAAAAKAEAQAARSGKVAASVSGCGSETQHWVMCDRCFKWRRRLSTKRLPVSHWYCQLNCDPLHDDCSHPEEEDSASASENEAGASENEEAVVVGAVAADSSGGASGWEALEPLAPESAIAAYTTSELPSASAYVLPMKRAVDLAHNEDDGERPSRASKAARYHARRKLSHCRYMDFSSTFSSHGTARLGEDYQAELPPALSAPLCRPPAPPPCCGCAQLCVWIRGQWFCPSEDGGGCGYPERGPRRPSSSKAPLWLQPEVQMAAGAMVVPPLPPRWLRDDTRARDSRRRPGTCRWQRA